MSQKTKGFTLIEMVVVIAILAVLLIIAMMSWRNQISKARDAQRKEDLQKISIAFEEYFSDFNCYPPEDILENCGGDELKPYLDKIPCDPITKQPYAYIIDPPAACSKNFRIFASLDNQADPAIAALNCGGGIGCGWGDPTLNYGISSTNVSLANAAAVPAPSPTPSPAALPSPTPLASPIWYYCQDTGNCTEVPPGQTCTPAYSDPNCGATNLCASTISTCN